MSILSKEEGGGEKTARYAKCDSVDVLHSHKGGGGEVTPALSRHLNVPCGLGRGTNVCLHGGRVSTKRRRTKRWTGKKEERRRGTAYSVQNNVPKSNQIELKHNASHIHIQRRTDTQHRPQAWTVYTLIRPPMCRIKLKVVVSYWLRRVLLTFIYLLACLHVNKRSVLSTNPCI